MLVAKPVLYSGQNNNRNVKQNGQTLLKEPANFSGEAPYGFPGAIQLPFGAVWGEVCLRLHRAAPAGEDASCWHVLGDIHPILGLGSGWSVAGTCTPHGSQARGAMRQQP